MTPARSASSIQKNFTQFSRVLANSGVRDALAFLLEQSSYRYIAIFRFEDGKANAAVYVDRENPGQLSIDEVPDTATYCCYVRSTEGVFTTANALIDPRLTSHPARETILAYCGVPIMNPEGVVLGTLCHYDTVPRDPDELEIELLLQVVSALRQGDHVPPYPAV